MRRCVGSRKLMRARYGFEIPEHMLGFLRQRDAIFHTAVLALLVARLGNTSSTISMPDHITSPSIPNFPCCVFQFISNTTSDCLHFTCSWYIYYSVPSSSKFHFSLPSRERYRDNFSPTVPPFAARISRVVADVQAPGGESGNV